MSSNIPRRSDSGDDAQSPFFAADPKSNRVRFILIEAETNQVIRQRPRKRLFPPDNQMAFMIHNRQFMRRQFMISAASMRGKDRLSRSQTHGMLTTQLSPSTQKTNNFLNILKQKAQTPKLRDSVLSMRNSVSMQRMSVRPSALTDVSLTTSLSRSIPSPRLREILSSPGCICMCPSLSVCSCGKRAAVRSFCLQPGSTRQSRVESVILDCEEAAGMKSKERLQSAGQRMLKQYRSAKKSIRRRK